MPRPINRRFTMAMRMMGRGIFLFLTPKCGVDPKSGNFPIETWQLTGQLENKVALLQIIFCLAFALRGGGVDTAPTTDFHKSKRKELYS